MFSLPGTSQMTHLWRPFFLYQLITDIMPPSTSTQFWLIYVPLLSAVIRSGAAAKTDDGQMQNTFHASTASLQEKRHFYGVYEARVTRDNNRYPPYRLMYRMQLSTTTGIGWPES